MQDFQEILALACVGFVLLSWAWIRQFGWKRGLLIALFRAGWVFPILLAVWPKLDGEALSSSLSLKTIHLLVDDSESMRDPESQSHTQNLLETLDESCRNLACRLQSTKLSELSEEVKRGYTPLAAAVKSWLPLTHGEPWILISDGGDAQPGVPWPAQLQGLGTQGNKQIGMIVGSPHPEQDNLWLEMGTGPDFGFDQKSVELEVAVHRRSQQKDQELTVQLQASSLGKNLASINVNFRPGEESLNVQIPLPPLARGTHLIKITVLPIGSESATWDNTLYKSLEVLPNTIGLLHLLGAPSWDGRFVRRYLKSEPKYDMISFFILRDPTDTQLTNERELSLIPFPVDRLFNEELPNFRAVVIQNFSLYQFLEPAYQKNLVDFVLNGGGLLFIGGPRALHELDISSSPLASLLPFKVKGAGLNPPDMMAWNDRGPAPFDPSVAFRIKPAEPDREKRLLATVFDDWLPLNFELEGNAPYHGLHRLDRVELAGEGFTPLLMAETEDGRESLLAAASYPGKGRAIWIFSDDLWRMALNPGPQGSREAYHSFLRSSMTWLLREELQRPLWLQDFSLQSQGKQTAWSVRVRGPAARFLQEGEGWTYRVCGQALAPKDLVRQMVSSDQWQLSGSVATQLASGAACELSIEGQHPAFGTVRTSIYGTVPEYFADKDIEGSFHRLAQLSQLTGASLLDPSVDEGPRKIKELLQSVTGKIGIAEKAEQKLLPDYYWVLNHWWCFLLFLFLPLEVLLRRWDALFGQMASSPPD